MRSLLEQVYLLYKQYHVIQKNSALGYCRASVRALLIIITIK